MTPKSLSRYMARIGRKGGLKRKLTTEEARKMAQASITARRSRATEALDEQVRYYEKLLKQKEGK